MYIHSAQHNTRCKTSENRVHANFFLLNSCARKVGPTFSQSAKKFKKKKKKLTNCTTKTLETVVKTLSSICAFVLFAFCKWHAFKDTHFTFSLNKIRKTLNVLEPIIRCSPVFCFVFKKLSLQQLVLEQQQSP